MHPQGDDLAITRIEPDHELYKFKSVSIDFGMFITKAIQDKVALGPGDETFTVGRFIARDERQSNAPIVRFGHISGLGTEFISVRRASGEFKQESFLVESHSISGFSGSPVFIWIPLERTMRFTNTVRESEVRKEARSYQHPPREYLLGVNWGHLEDTHPPGMAGVVPAWKLLELLKLAEVVEMRREKEKSNAKIVRAKLDVHSPHSQKTLAPNEADRIDIPVPTEREVLNVFKKVTQKRKPSS